MRKIAIAAGLVVAIILIAVILAPFLIDANTYRGRIEALLSSQLGRRVTLGNLSFRLLPLNFKADSLVIAEDPRFAAGQPFARCAEVSVSPRLLPLLHHDIDISSLELRRPAIELIRNAQGTWNFASLGSGAARSDQAGQQPSAQNFQLGSLVITDGKLTVQDLRQKRPAAVYDHIDVEVSNFAPASRFPVRVSLHLPGSGSELVELAATAGPMGADASRIPVDGTLTLKQVSLAALRSFAGSGALAAADATLDGSARLQSQDGRLASSGNFTARNVVVNGKPLAQPVGLDYSLAQDPGSDLLHISEAIVKVGSTPIHLSGQVNLKPETAELNLHVRAADAPLADVAQLAAAAGASLPPGAAMQGRMNLDVTVVGPADAPELNGSISAQNAQLNGIPHPLSIKQLSLALQPHPGEPAARLAAPDPMARMLNGNMNLNLADGQIGNLNFLREAASAGKFLLGTQSSGNLTQLLKVTGNFNLVNGVAATNDLQAVLADGPSAAATGTIDMVRQLLNLRVTAVLPPALAQKAGAGGLGGALQTVLANPKGELVVPLLVSGTFEHPSFAPDLQQMAQMRLKNLAPTLDNPGALSQVLSGKSSALGQALGTLGKGQQSGNQPNQGAAGLLNSILGGKKKPPQ
ncbi:MAG: AsmA family protein [Acidobacteria bacterium]|nr:AsmA family protein [Acidobacteriota bacterium]